MSNILEISNLYKSFNSGGEEIRVLRGLSLDVEEGDFISIMGPSGSGKSTLLHIIGGLLHPDKGEVKLEGKSLYARDDTSLAGIRNKKIGFIFQFHHLLADFTVLENLIIPLLIKGREREEAVSRARDLLDTVGLLDRENAKPAVLSGGERQRIAVLRAMITRPSILLADEPTGDLDREHADTILRMLEDFQGTRGMTVLLVTHNPRVAKLGKKTYNLFKGRLKKE